MRRQVIYCINLLDRVLKNITMFNIFLIILTMFLEILGILSTSDLKITVTSIVTSSQIFSYHIYHEIISLICILMLLINLKCMKILNKTNIQKPPSWQLRNIAKFLYSKKTYERVFEPQLSDYAEEYLEALSRGAKYQATWIKCRETINFFLLLIVHCPFAKIVDMLDKVRKISK